MTTKQKQMTAMSADTATTELKEALTVFETSLATPIVSGELAEWLDAAKAAWTKVYAQIRQTAEQGHPSQLEEIGAADPELLPKVEQLQAEDTAIEQDGQAFGQALTRAANRAPKLEPNEGIAQQHVQKLIDDGIALVTRVRKQEVAIQTWFVEAFNRDRGAVD